MSKPYQHTFESIQSPLSGPGGYSNPASPVGGQPPSFKTNLNRAKTKKWVEAKGYSYDGDDWGEVDEYDEYGGYDEPQPPAVPAVPAMPPLPKQPTGLRQKGQSAASPRSSPQTEQTGVFSPPAKQGSSPSIGHQQHYNGPSAVASSGSSAVPRGVSPGRPRANSFEQGDDAVAMPSALAEPGGAWGQVSSNEDQSHIPIRTSATGSPVSHSPTLHPWASGEAHAPQAEQKPPPLRIETQSVAAGAPPQPPTVSPKYATYSPSPSAGSHRAVSDTDRRHPSGPASRRQSVDSNAPSVELQSRRDFSPSVAPQRNPSASNSPNPNEFRFPPRKSSLSQRTASWNRTPRPYEDVSQAFPQSPGSETLQSPISDQGGFSTTKATTFVRPADIYKRIEAERERERRSLDSGRPSLDSVRSRSSEPERVTSPPLRERLSSESLGRSIRGRSSFDGTGDLESNRRLKPMLDPVKERKSEYGFEGFSYEAAKAAEEQSKNPVDASSKAGQRDSRPILPDLNRISAFGDSLFGPTLASSDFLSGPEGQPPEAIAGPTVTEPVRDVANEKTLEHQPSLGFRSVVNQAFDRKDDKSVPPTPSSTDRSDIRSGSESTTEISPIMSRVPDIASLDAQAGNAAKTQPEMGAITEEINEFDAGSRPTSTATAIPADVVRTPSPPPSAHSRKTSENLPQGFVPGHRRDLSTPSPANSPARSPALKSTETNAAEKQAEVTSATPTDAQAVHHPSEQPSGPPTGLPEVASETEGQDLSINDTSNPLDQAEVEKVALEHRSPEASPTREPRSPTFSVSPRSGSESPSKGRVRDLAGMFDLNERSSRRGSATSFSSRGSVTEKAKDATDASRLVPNRLESFRPSLPGGWVSFSTMADNSPSRLSVVTDDTAAKEAGQKDAIRNENVPEFGPALQGPSEEGLDLVQTSAGQGALSPESRVPEHDAFAAAAAAGAAMGASIADSVRQLRERGGFDSTSPSDYERNEHTDTSLESSIHSHVAPHFEIHSDEDVVDQGLDAQTSSPMPQLLTPSNLESSGSPSVGPTPPPKDTPYQTGRAESDYFPPTLPLKHKSINPAMQPPILNPTVRPEILPSLSTETSPQDLESDRLRKEIVRRLSPMSSSEQDALRELEDSEGVPDNADSKSFDPARESTFLPSEYDSYWDHGERDDDEDEDDEVTSGSRTPPARAEQSLHPVELESDQFTLAKASHEPAAEPEQHRDVPLTEQAGAASTMAQGPPLLKKKFSWEEDSRSQSPESVELHPPDYPSHGEAFEIPKPVSSEETRDSLQSVSTTIPHEQQLGEGQSSKDLQYSKREFSVPSGYRSSLPPYEEAMDVADGVAPDTASSEAPEPLRSSTSTGLHDIEIPASRPTSTALEHTSVIPAEQAPVVDQEKTGPIVGAPDDVAQSTQTTSQQKMPSFRDILALTNPFDRIQSYNIARKQLAESDSGLSNWITSITAANPEYADLVSTNREASQPAGSSTKRSVSSIQGPTHASGSIRITSHHMQTKGKDLLHSAGALGGRANIAAKGLFSKGRNKLRGSNAEKVDT
ncbi:hypothetical protein L228DRAFT_250100 [Xylona heveae TC161]|uniref:Uncharacterized protein n=1 Tax=Xylona heveae (strain CBS 132557 / TC161) TaxID=1328760 RepID=A0A165AG24_XYLHT|nr:hypothetical protein L228DRAFT_250100 [Xylona heveae TC161]KZF20417.1 hypothetical protein L228DRAFT_250100 [Xylona heveae TC161]